MTDEERVEQIRRATASAQPSIDNPAWAHSHNNVLFLLHVVDKLTAERKQHDEYGRKVQAAVNTIY